MKNKYSLYKKIIKTCLIIVSILFLFTCEDIGFHNIPGPSSVNATATSSNSITISWSGVRGANGYKIYCSTSLSGFFTEIGTTTTGRSYTDNYLRTGTTYYYKVAAFNNHMTGVMSNVVSATTTSNGADVSGIPTVSGNPTSTSITVNTVTIPNNPGGQTVEYAINTSTAVPTSGWQTGTTFTGLTANTTYYIFARSAAKNDYNYYNHYNEGTAQWSSGITTSNLIIDVSSIGLNNLKVGQAVSGASITYTLISATYASIINSSNFAVLNLPPGLTAGTAVRTSNTVVTISVTGTPVIHSSTPSTIMIPTSIPASNITGATSALEPVNIVTASAVAMGDGAAVSGAPIVSGMPLAYSITVNPVTIPTNFGNQTVQYVISTSTTVPTTGWQFGTTFNGCVPNTMYYVYARSAANANYNAGAAQRSLGITTTSSNSVPGTPIGVNAITRSLNSIEINWNTVSGATQYIIYRWNNSEFIQIGTSTTTSYTDTGLTSNTTYYYTVAASNSNGTGSQSNYVEARTSSPVILVTSTGLDNLKVNQAVSNASIIYTVSNGAYVSSITASNFNVSNLPPGLTTGTAVQINNTVVTIPITGTPTAFSSSTRIISLPSIPASQVSGATGDIWPTGTVIANAVIMGDGATVSGAPTVSGTPTSISITVNPVTILTNPGSQTVQYAISMFNTAPTSGWQSGTTFTGLTEDTTYYVYARSAANNNYNEGVAHRSAGITTSRVSVPRAPSGVNATAASTTSITVSWDSVSGANGYRVYRSTSSTGTFTEIGTSTTTSFTNYELSANTTYFYRVAAYNNSGTGSQSSTVNTTTAFINLILNNPTTVNITSGTRVGVSFTVPWNGGGTYRFVSSNRGSLNPTAYSASTGGTVIDDDGAGNLNYMFERTLTSGQTFTYWSGVYNNSGSGTYTITVTRI
ncbi:MAG: fibronectin type III domain-containing protein [Treponema sp.]|nr:fibronectin type III domain-containing protein [Treponema sp.]